MAELKEFEIRNRFTGAVILCGKYESMKDCLEQNKKADLYGADLHGADLHGADLHGAYLHGADLHGADLHGADLHGAYLHGAYLHGANLQGAKLYGADLYGADLQGANLQGADLLYGLDNLYCLKLFLEETVLHFWKYLKNGLSPYQNFKYEIGRDYQFENCNQDERESCGAGGNVATLQWCLKDNNGADEFIEVEFQVKDIVAIPYCTDGKFRVKKFKVLRKINRKEAIELLTSKMNKP
jgi:hypothetical protein